MHTYGRGTGRARDTPHERVARTRATHVTSAATQRSRCVRIVRDRAAGGLA